MPHAKTSLAAFHSLHTGPIKDKLIEIIEGYGPTGCICDELLSFFPSDERRNAGSVTGRFIELERDGRIFRNGDTRPGLSGREQMVIRHPKFKGSPCIPHVKARTKKNPFLDGLRYAAKIMMSSSDLTIAKMRMRDELLKAATR